jgi:hypothetical protein
MGISQAVTEVERDRYKEALERVDTAGHPEWCNWSCFGGEEAKACDCWVIPARTALSEVEKPS